MQSKLNTVLFLGLLLFISACDDDTDTQVEEDLQIERGDGGNLVARFDPSTGEVPSPNNLAFLNTKDGTLNIEVDDENNTADPKVALNSLDGFSTIAPITTAIGAAADSGTFNSNTIKLFEVALDANGLVDSSTAPTALTYGADYVASVSTLDPTGKTIVISPIKPLKPKTSYLVALTTGMQSTDGRNLRPDSAYNITKSTAPLHIEGISQVKVLTNEQAVRLEALRPFTNAQEAALAGAGINSSSVAISWVFSTQSIGEVLTTVKGLATSSNSVISPTSIGTASLLLGGSAGIAEVYVGTLTLPYYLSNANSSPADPLSKFWSGAGGTNLTRFMPTPEKTSDESIPLLVSIPNNVTKPVGGWPVVMFQHGITANRSNMLAIAETLASVGFAVVAIDLPLHGLLPGSSLYSGIERTFDLDLANNTTLTSCSTGDAFPCPDGTADTSGKHFINLGNLQVTRDNLRQGIADQFALFNALSAMDYDGGDGDFDTDKVYFLGHSLGGMVGAVFAALEPGVRDIVLAMPGGGIAKLLDGSATFGPVIEAGLAAAGVVKGTAEYESFMGAAQTLMDSGDPINYTQASNPTRDTVSGRGVLMFEIVGDGSDNLPDQVIPNNVMALAPSGTIPAPLSGTDPLFTYMGLLPASTYIGLMPANATVSGTDLKQVVYFTAGDHSSILDPGANGIVTAVMQTAVATFFATDGDTLTISDTSVVE